MTNAEKYLKDGIDVEFVDKFEKFCAKQTGNQASSVRLIQFLSRAVTPTLTEDERVILRNMTKPNIKAIGRSDSALYLQDNTGEKNFFMNYMYRDLFQFIKERRRILNRRTFERRIEMDWIISQAPNTTIIPTGDNLLYIIQTTEIIDNKGTLYKKVDCSTLMKDKKIEEQEPNIVQSRFKKFSERGTTQKRRTHTNKRAKQN